MFTVNLRLPRMLWLLLGALIPLLFLLDWAVGRSGRRAFIVEAELSLRLDGGDPLTLALPLDAMHDREGLSLTGTAALQGARYPWKPTPLEASLDLRLSQELLDDPNKGAREQGFIASLVLKDTSRPDGLGMPRIPCGGAILVEELRSEAQELLQMRLRLDLLCSSSGPDMRWNTGDERVWTMSGPIQLRSIRAKE